MTFGRLTTQLKKLLKANWFYFWVFFLFFIAIRFYPFLLGKTLVYGDNYSLMIPGKIFTAEYIKQGILPLWNPYIFSGMPWIADINQSVLYPSTLLFIFFSPAIALNFLLIIHALIAYSGMYFLAKKYIKNNLWSLLAGSLWMFSTQISGSMNNFSTLQSLVWLPWLGYFGLQLINKNQAKFLFALVITLQFLGGYPQHVLYGIGLAVLLSVNDNSATFIKWLKAWLVTASLTLAMSAVAWLPFAEVLFNSTRMEQTSEQALVGSLNPIMLIKFVLPYFFDNPSAGVKWGPAWSGQPNVGIYMTWLGWTAIIASFISLLKICKKKKKQNLILKKWQREVIFFATISISTLIFSLGEYLPGFNIIQKYLPLFRIARYPSMVMIVTNLVIILWAVKALKNWQVSYNSYKWLMRLGLAALAVGLVGFGVKQYWFNDAWRIFNSWSSYILSKSVFHTLDRDKIILFQISTNIIFNSIFFMVSLYFLYQKKLTQVVMILSFEILINTQGLFFFAPKKIYDTTTDDSQHIVELTNLKDSFVTDGNNSRILTRNSNTAYTDYGSYWEAMIVRRPFSDSFVDSEELQQFSHVQHLRDGLTPNWNMVYGVPVVHGYTALLPQDYAHLWQTSVNPRINFIDRIEPDNDLLKQWAVKYYLVDAWFDIQEDLTRYPLVAEYKNWSLYELPTLTRFRFGDATSAELKDFNETPNQISFLVDNQTNQSQLIMADRYDVNWLAKVNGEKVEIENYQDMRMIEIQPGKNEVRFYYYPRLFYLGLVISGLTLLGSLMSLLISKRFKLRKTHT